MPPGACAAPSSTCRDRREPPPGLSQTPLMEDELVVIGRAGHPLSGAETASLEALSGYPWIVGQAGTPLRSQWEALFAGHALPPAPIECGSVMVIREVLRESDFLTLLSADQVALEIGAGVLTQIGPPLAGSSRTIGITVREGWRPTAAQARLIALIESAAATTVPENE